MPSAFPVTVVGDQGKPDWSFSSLHSRLLSPGSKQDKIDGYAEWAASYDRDVTNNDYRGPTSATNIVMSLLDEKKKQESEEQVVTEAVVRVLDAGCGTGITAEVLTKAALAQKDMRFSIVGLDYSPEMLELAKQKNLYADVRAADLNEPLQVDGQLFDFAISTGVFMDGHCGPSALVNVLNVLAPGGCAVITVRNESYEQEKMNYTKAISSVGCKISGNVVMPYLGPVVANYITISKGKE